jgi:hypothetical protein
VNTKKLTIIQREKAEFVDAVFAAVVAPKLKWIFIISVFN